MLALHSRTPASGKWGDTEHKSFCRPPWGTPNLSKAVSAGNVESKLLLGNQDLALGSDIIIGRRRQGRKASLSRCTIKCFPMILSFSSPSFLRPAGSYHHEVSGRPASQSASILGQSTWGWISFAAYILTGFGLSLQGRAVQFQRLQDLPRTRAALRQDRREGKRPSAAGDRWE